MKKTLFHGLRWKERTPMGKIIAILLLAVVIGLLAAAFYYWPQVEMFARNRWQHLTGTTEVPPPQIVQPTTVQPKPAAMPQTVPPKTAPAVSVPKRKMVRKLKQRAQTFNPNTSCSYVNDVTWRHWGGAPYGPTADEALSDQKLDWYLRCSTEIPQDLKAKVKAAIRANPRGERIVYLTPDMVLPDMAAGPDRSHRFQYIMRNVKVARIMEAFGIVGAAETRAWFVERPDGTILGVGDPLKCGNLCIIQIIPPQAHCVELTFNAPIGGKVRWGDASIQGKFPPSACNAQKQGNGTWEAWYGECGICILTGKTISYIRSILGDEMRIVRRYLYPVIEEKQTIRFSIAVRDTVVYVCLEDPSGKRTYGVYIRPQDWKGRYRVDIPNSMWAWQGNS
ncbi:MAG: hypothetical protein ACYC75_00290 [Minisyncoccota bacterium]